MDIGYTPRGFALVKFKDRNGLDCTLQESSNAEGSFVWFGPSAASGAASRMHIDETSAVLVSTVLNGLTHGHEGLNLITFNDSLRNLCTITRSADHVSLSVVQDMDGRTGLPMVIDEETAKGLLPLLKVFIDHGQLVAPDENDDAAPAEIVEVEKPRHLDVKIPPSTLSSTDVAGTGVSLQELIDGFQLLLDGTHDHDVADMVGHDNAEQIIRMRNALKPYWRDSTGKLVLT